MREITSKLLIPARISVFFLASAATTLVFGQEEGAVAADDEEIEEVVVTGSRIVRSNLIGTTPVTQVDAEEVIFQGTVRVEDIMRNIPQVYSSQNTGQSNGATGTATLNLRNLGSLRTLVLVNGRRMPAGSPIQGGAGVDINQIPGALIDRVEVLTGGASATYGSDAISGVVNFIMDDDFEGVAFDYQTSAYFHANENDAVQGIVGASGFPVANDGSTDGEISQFSVTVGGSFLDGGNIVGYATYRDIKHMLQSSRDYSSCALNDDASSCWGSSTIPEGRVTNFLPPTLVGFDYKVEGSQFVPRAGTLFNYGPLNYFQRPDERTAFGSFATLDISDTTEVYAELMFADDHTVSQIAPSGAFFVTNTIHCGNPLLSGQQYNLLTEARLTADQRTALDAHLATLSSEQKDKFLDANFCQNRVDDTITAYIGRRNVEGGNRQQDLRHTSFRTVLGARGELTEDWSFDAFFQRSVVSMENTYLNDLGTTKIKRALDAVYDDDGNIVCRSVVTGDDLNCVPWNLFETGGPTDEAINYLVLPLFARGTTEQQILSAYVEGDMTERGWKSPLADSSVIIVAGIEKRRETLAFEPDEGFRNGEGAGQGGATEAISGGYTVTEVFGEASVPLVEGEELMDALNLDVAMRYSDFSTGVSATTWGVRLGWVFNNEFTLRASQQAATRGASVRELFQPQGFNLFDMKADPCGGPITDGETASGYTFEQCARSGVTQAHWGNIQHSPAGQYNFLQGGNTDLEPEESDTTLFGFIWEPSMIEGLALTFDIFDIEITSGISSIGAEFIVTQCIEGNDDMCQFVNRSSSLGDLWIGSNLESSGHVVARQANLSTERIGGYDIVASYDLSLGDFGGLTLQETLSFFTKWDFKEIDAAPANECAGLWGGDCGIPTPELRHNLRAIWETPWNATASVMWRHQSEIESYSEGAPNLDAVNYFDAFVQYELGENYLIRAGMNNVFDQAPPIAGNGAGPSIQGNGNIFPGSYDGFGRYMFAGLSVSL